MQPVRLDIEGFTAFRDPVTIDFAGADLFALTGPTGAGKSSVVDALVFALYGSVPRLDRRVVAPVISLGRTEARVRFVFTIAGEAYVAVRVVRRTKTGASTREATLERCADGEVLAGNERELTAEIERLLGLGFEQFIKCVVLPQGEFMRLLHDEPAKRQDLLVSLLDIGLYEAMGRAANRRATLAEEGAAVAERLLEKLAGATPQTRAAAEAELAALEEVRSDLALIRPRLDALKTAEIDARTRARAATARAGLLRAIELPTGLADRTADTAAMRALVERCSAEEVDAERCAEQATAALDGLPPRADVEALLEAHEQRRRLGERRAAIVHAIDSARMAEAEATSVHAAAVADVAAGGVALERARWMHRADDLARSLVIGEPCPVCRQGVDALPEPDGSDAVDVAVAAHAEVEARLRQATATLVSAERDRLAAETRLTALTEQIATIDARLHGAPEPGQLQATMAEVRAAETALNKARTADRKARRASADARMRRQVAVAADHADRRRFTEARDQVAALGPPSAGHDDLVTDWTALVEWAAAAGTAEEFAVHEATHEATKARAARTELTEFAATRCSAAGIDVSGGDLFDAVVDHVVRARASLARIDADMAEAARYRAEAIESSKAATVARDLARHLSASHFEKWMLNEALGLLVAGATHVLLDLTRGDYSLALDERSNFLVIDHRAADEVRSARTLSGGETFVASLALALALADQIGQLAANGAARLESIFLDEGFGALDPDTLDTVAVAIEELGARGRTVGLISHLPELAERVPIRFEVVKGAATSTVVRVVV